MFWVTSKQSEMCAPELIFSAGVDNSNCLAMCLPGPSIQNKLTCLVKQWLTWETYSAHFLTERWEGGGDPNLFSSCCRCLPTESWISDGETWTRLAAHETEAFSIYLLIATGWHKLQQYKPPHLAQHSPSKLHPWLYTLSQTHPVPVIPYGSYDRFGGGITWADLITLPKRQLAHIIIFNTLLLIKWVHICSQWFFFLQ